MIAFLAGALYNNKGRECWLDGNKRAGICGRSTSLYELGYHQGGDHRREAQVYMNNVAIKVEAMIGPAEETNTEAEDLAESLVESFASGADCVD